MNISNPALAKVNPIYLFLFDTLMEKEWFWILISAEGTISYKIKTIITDTSLAH